MHAQSRLNRSLPLTLTVALACGDSPTDPARNPPDNDNRAYIDAIVPHHVMATMMADEAIMKSTREQLRNMAQMMKEDQAEEIAIFRDTRLRLFESEATPSPMPMEPIPSGPEFDRIWLQRMIVHHQGAIDVSLLARQAGVVETLDSLAREGIVKQRREQGEMRDSISAWYGGPP